ncbi:MAG TPA: MBL fold metallo-hydrolase, partial [Desulfomonilia bacterium]|nr:MBL fold metallo-hydrolase [Desulfomonilia bacterium]
MGKNKFNLSFKWVGAATWVLAVDDVKIACDPVLCPKDTVQNYALGMKGKRRTEPAYVDKDFQNVDLWLITHNHEDHLDQRGLMVIDPKATIITHKNASKMLNTIHPRKLSSMEWGQTLSYK